MIRLVFRPNDLHITPVSGQVMGRNSLGVGDVKRISRDHFRFNSVGQDSVGIEHLSSGSLGGLIKKGSEDVETVSCGSDIVLRMGDKYRVIHDWDAFYLEPVPGEEVGAPQEESVQSPPGGGASLSVAGMEPTELLPDDIQPVIREGAAEDEKYVQFGKHGYDIDTRWMDDADIEDNVAYTWSSGAATITTETFSRRTGFKTKLQRSVPVVQQPMDVDGADIENLQDEKKCHKDSGKWRSPTLIRRMRKKMARSLQEDKKKLVDDANEDCDKLTVMWLEKRKAQLTKSREAAVLKGDEPELQEIDADIAEVNAKLEAALTGVNPGNQPCSVAKPETGKRVIHPVVTPH